MPRYLGRHQQRDAVRTAHVGLVQRCLNNYSVHMEDELASLEVKISQMATLCHQLRRENIDLRQQLAASSSENKQLARKIDEAKIRLATLLGKIPSEPLIE